MEKTKVKFLIERDSKNDVFAFFPEEKYNERINKDRMCYAHAGQHQSCSLGYTEDCKEATKDEYANLLNELTNDIGYDLEVLNIQK